MFSERAQLDGLADQGGNVLVHGDFDHGAVGQAS
jgi:hypothetical protein